MCRLPFLLALALPLAAAVADPAWISRAWQTEDGLLNNEVTAITQAEDGALLVATQRGLSRFDGLRWREVPTDVPGRSGRSVTGLLTTQDGALWMVTRTVVVCLRPGRPQEVLEMPAVEADSGRITAFFEQPGGVIWIAFEGGRLHRIKKGRIEQAAAASGLSPTFATCAALDSEGRVWAAGSGVLACWRGDRFEPVAAVPQGKIVMAGARAGGLWVGAGRKLLRVAESSRVVEVADLPDELRGARVACLHEDRHGTLWLGTVRGGLQAWDGARFHTAQAGYDVWWLCEDRESSIWAATSGGGACCVRPRVLTLLDEPGAPTAQIARDICQDARGHLWVATTAGKLFVRRAEGWHELAANKDWPGPGAACVTAAPDGAVWIATSQGDLVHWDGVAFIPVPLPPDPRRSSIMTMLVARDGGLWIARGFSLFHGKPGQWHEQGVPDGRVVSLAQDAAGHVWAGTLTGALLRAENNMLVRKAAQELDTHGGGIRAMLPAADGSLWIASEGGGISQLIGGRCRSITTAHGLPNDAVSQLALDKQGRVWACSDLGVFMIPLTDLTAAAEGRQLRLHATLFGRNEGVPGLQATGGSSVAAADGRVWLSTSRGLAVVDTTRVGINTTPPHASIEEMIVNEKETVSLWQEQPAAMPAASGAISAAPSVRLQPGVRTLAFEFGASSFIAPENVRLRYLLAGIDPAPRLADADRRAVYGHIPPGDYALHLSAANNDGVWSTHETILSLHVSPFYYETAWFRFLVVLAAIMFVIFIGYRIARARYRRRTEALRREAAVHAERTRIARDMHDQVGASLTQISLLSDIALAQGGDIPQLNRLAETARDAVTALDEIVWAVDPAQDRFDSLIEYLAPQITELAQAAGLRSRLDFPAQTEPRHLTAAFRHQLFLIIREAVNNIIKHARATELKLHISTTSAFLTIEITDNGTGFAPAAASGHGLPNMRSRAAALAGALEIHSSPEGSQLKLTVPWPAQEG